MLNPAVPEGTFRRAFTKGAGSGALMMGIFSGLHFTAIATGVASLLHISPGIGLLAASAALPSMLGMVALGMIATGLFSGITALQRSAASQSAAHTVSQPALRVPAHAPEQTLAPVIERAAHNSHEWTQRVSQNPSSGRDRVASILADHTLTDADRAAAILHDREQSNALNASR